MAESAAVATERAQRVGLRRMKGVAGGLLLAVAVLYVVTWRWEVAGAPGWVGYVNAAAEAGMIGALADWFAVTALFRRPMGLPIPHTAIIPTRKDALAANLQRFVGENFLSEAVVRDKLHRAGLVLRAAGWLREPAHAARVTGELGTLVRAALVVLDDDDVQRVLEDTLVRRLAEWPVGPPAGRLLDGVVEDGTHHRLVDIGLDEGLVWLVENADVVERVVLAQAPTWSPRFVDVAVAHRVHAEVLRFLREVRADPDHRVRHALDAFLVELARDLREDPTTMARAEDVKRRVMAHPRIREAVEALGATARRVLLEALDDPDSALRERVTSGLVALGERVTEDAELRAKLDTWVEDAATHVVTRYRDELTEVITDTVNRWDAEETSERIELHVGRDLQFIRINGTVVGALAGLVIHAVTTLLL
jgi:uncharacterized membrane-anchored protein YjiN (DUF445 family)